MKKWFILLLAALLLLAVACKTPDVSRGRLSRHTDPPPRRNKKHNLTIIRKEFL